jgi:hypothetical protein
MAQSRACLLNIDDIFACPFPLFIGIAAGPFP